jgi:small-conductance mechanosensitive channel
MKKPQKLILSILAALLFLSLAGVIYTRNWTNYHEQLHRARTGSNRAPQLVDTRALETAQQLAPLAETHTEQGYAQEALRLADHSVDLAFAAALEDAESNPAPLTPQTRAISSRLNAAQASVAADQDRIAQLTQQVAKARPATKDALQEQLDLAKAQLELDQDEVDDTHQELIRAGGDKHATIQILLDQHEASEQHTAPANSFSSTAAVPSPELTKSRSLAPNVEAWFSLHAKENLLVQAQQNALARESALSSAHDALGKQVSDEKAQKQILHRKPKDLSQGSSALNQSTSPQPTSTLSFLRRLTEDQKDLNQLDKRIADEQQLAAAYANWIAYVQAKKRAFLHGIVLGIFWVLLIGVCVFVSDYFVRRFFSRLAPEARQLHAASAGMVVALNAVGVILILLVLFGVPNNFGTVLALAGAGLTVAMKDFILGFIGWFVLMGKNGIQHGDWVEINGVGGEVLEVGPFRTTLLETGNWSDAAHPTGRKVTFVNSFAIEGHYFNFSTSGQWLWDELQVLVPAYADPYSLAEAIQKITADETEASARGAEQEWERVVSTRGNKTFSAAPSMSILPVATGVNVVVRYITRARERQEVRTRLYRAVVDLLRQKNVPESDVKPIRESAARKQESS